VILVVLLASLIKFIAVLLAIELTIMIEGFTELLIILVWLILILKALMIYFPSKTVEILDQSAGQEL